MTRSARELFDRLLTVITVGCACIVTGLLVARELHSSTPQITPGAVRFLDDWKLLASGPTKIGPSDAKVQLVEFGDFECPACASLSETLEKLRLDYPAEVSITFVHFPLVGHPFAIPAAKAADCAAEQSKFPEMYSVLYTYQSYFGSISWEELATKAGVTNIPQFRECVSRSAIDPLVLSGSDRAKRLGLLGTPSLFINGWAVDSTRDSRLREMVQAVLAGKEPVAATLGSGWRKWIAGVL